MDQDCKGSSSEGHSSMPRKQTSMCSLISWNISKAFEANPNINLKLALNVTQERLEKDGHESQGPEEQHLTCALLAWRKLGRRNASSLYQFVESKQNQPADRDEKIGDKATKRSSVNYEDSKFSEGRDFDFVTPGPMSPAHKLPLETGKIVMRFDDAPSACCKERACMDKLNEVDKSVNELRVRAERLARREAERVALLERADAAWKDLEQGFRRRLSMGEEKEEDMAKRIKILIEDRNGYKSACATLADQLRERGEVAERERAKLTEVEKELHESALRRARVSEEAARFDATLAEQQCRAAQLDRDFEFKEQQMRRKLQLLKSELESAQCLTHAAGSARRAELEQLRQQVTQASAQLLGIDADNGRVKDELEIFRQMKLDIMKSLEGCKAVCEERMKDKMDDLKQKRQQLAELKEKWMGCQCKLPVDASVEVTRTPSLAILCECSQDYTLSDSCSCTSLRSTLLSTMLADLFAGLKSELGAGGTQMPCQLLKCLEDHHNWDRTSVIKTNLHQYFSKLLIGELDIAIATSIEKYHAKWIGASCADENDKARKEERLLEQRAQKLAATLAEQLFKERADQLTARAREIVNTAGPLCQCKAHEAAVYPVLVKQPMIQGSAAMARSTSHHSASPSPTFWRRTYHDVTQLRQQLEDIKKNSIKKKDLKMMEENIMKLVRRATEIENTNTELTKQNDKKETNIKCNHRSINTEQVLVNNTSSKFRSMKKKPLDRSLKKGNKDFIFDLKKVDVPLKSFKKLGGSLAVNLCLCNSNKDTKKMVNVRKNFVNCSEVGENKPMKDLPDTVSQIFSVKQIKPVHPHTPAEITNGRNKKKSGCSSCRSDIKCFHKDPSSASIDKLLEALAQWNSKNNKNDITNNSNKRLDLIVSDVKNKNNADNTIFNNLGGKVSKKLSPIPYNSNIKIKNSSKSTEISNNMPMNTQSEYIRAINLDSVSGNREDYDKENPCIFKCINPADCDCKTSSEINKEKIKNTSLNARKPVQDYCQLPQNKVTTENAIFASDCQYCIKFLGVTLTNANSNENVPDITKSPNNEPSLLIENTSQPKNHQHEVRYNNVEITAREKKYDKSELHCSGKCKKVMNILDSSAINQHGDFGVDENQFTDTLRVENVSEIEACVCCDSKADESKELEVNAFQLLKSHLRENLREFKESTCHSSCIGPEEEEKLFSNIFLKVKQVITDSMGGTNCQCASKEPIEGSWKRAHMLLEEYLKIKIKRAHCSCLPVSNNDETKLADVLEKVCTLIDKDFNLLKNICKCKEVGKSNMPEKDENDFFSNSYVTKNNNVTDANNLRGYCCNVTNIPTSKEINKDNHADESNSSNEKKATVTQIISCPNLIFMDTKSCDALKIDTRSEQTSHILTNKCCETTNDNNDQYFCTRSVSTNDLPVSQCVEVQKDIPHVDQTHVNDSKGRLSYTLGVPNGQHLDDNVVEMLAKIPYRGNTVDCSCDKTLGTCNCIKSLLCENKYNINNIFNTFTSNKRQSSLSYIMDTVAKKHIKEYNSEDVRNVDTTKMRTTCDTKAGSQYYGQIILKDSNLKVNKNYKSATTSGDGIYSDDDYNSEPKWCDCKSDMKQNTINIKNFSDNIHESSVHYYLGKVMNRKSTCLNKSEDINLSNLLSSGCDCNMVPMCHVKLLVKNIESKLLHSGCTCDSLCSNVCPVHSNKD